MIQNITYKKTTLAILIKATYQKKKGINFFTNKSLNQQVAYMHHPKNYEIHPHLHKKLIRKITGTSEVLIILSGKMKINFYDSKNALKYRVRWQKWAILHNCIMWQKSK